MTRETRHPIASRAAYWIATVALLTVAGCGADMSTSIVFSSSGSRSYTIDSGRDFTITLQTVGPGEYQSPPSVSSSVVVFRDVAQAAMSVPAGPTQLFRFHATSAGQAVVVFRHSDTNPTVTDTVVVR